MGPLLSRVTTTGAGTRLRGLRIGCTVRNLNMNFNANFNTSRGGIAVGVCGIVRNNLALNTGSCCLGGSTTAMTVHRTFGACITGVFRLCNFSTTSTTGGTRGMFLRRADLTAVSGDHARLHSPRTGCGGVDLGRFGRGCPGVPLRTLTGNRNVGDRCVRRVVINRPTFVTNCSGVATTRSTRALGTLVR